MDNTNTPASLAEARAQGKGVRFKNSLTKSRRVKITFTADNDQATAALSQIALLAGKGKASLRTLPAGVTVSGDYTIAADFYEAMGSRKFAIEKIGVETSDSSNFEGTKLVIGSRNLNDRNNSETDIFLADHQESTGQGIKKTANIDTDALAGGLMVEAPIYVLFQNLKKNTSITFYLYVSHVEALGELDVADF